MRIGNLIARIRAFYLRMKLNTLIDQQHDLRSGIEECDREIALASAQRVRMVRDLREVNARIDDLNKHVRRL